MNKTLSNECWYTLQGLDQDVAVSTKIVYLRNLANFPFINKLSPSDKDHIFSIVVNAFSKVKNSSEYQTLVSSMINEKSQQIMKEREILDAASSSRSGIIIKNDGEFSCTVNENDHLKMTYFFPGMDIDSCVKELSAIDKELQKHVQFAANYEFGYLNSRIVDSGSGMRIRVRLHLPAISLQHRIPLVMENCTKNGLIFAASFGAGGSSIVSGFSGIGNSLGFYYDIMTSASSWGSELDQIANISTVVKKIIQLERVSREECREVTPSLIKNFAFRAIALSNSSIFIPLKESIEIISGIKMALNCGLVKGIDDQTLHALLFRVQEGHLDYVLETGEFSFAKDIASSPNKKKERLRALIIQEAFEKLDLVED